MSRFVCVCGVVLALTTSFLFGQENVLPVEPAKLIRMDSDERLAAQLNEDRLLKYLIRTSVSSSTNSLRINQNLLEKVVAQSLNDGSALKEIGVSLGQGDERLQQAVVKFLKAVNFSPQQIDQTVLVWAQGNPPDALGPIMKDVSLRSNVLDFFGDYLLNTKNSWSKVCNNVDLVLRGNEALTPAMLQIALVDNNLVTANLIGPLFKEAAQKNPTARLRLMRSVEDLLEISGTAASYLELTGAPPPSWYENIWEKVETQVAEDPQLLGEYITRLKTSSYLYDTWRNYTIEALQTDEFRFFSGYYEAAQIPNSRFEWLYTNLVGNNGTQIIGTDDTPRVTVLATETIAKMKEDVTWTDYIMWQLTRPAEAFTLTLRYSLPNVLSHAPDTVWAMLNSLSQFNAPFKAELDKTKAFDFYGSPSVFRAKTSEKKLTPEALASFGSSLGKLLAGDDYAWSTFITSADQEGSGTSIPGKVAVIAEAITSDVPTSIALIKTLQTNDARLFDKFANWLVKTQKRGSVEIVTHWLDEVVRELNAGQITNNAEIANFKQWFVEFVNLPEGWQPLYGRITIESSGVNELLREDLASYLVKNDASLWSILRATTATSGVVTSTLVPRFREFIVRAKYNELLLEEISQQNHIATAAVYQVWPELLTSEAPTTQSIIETIKNGSILGDLYSVFATALIEVIQKPEFGKMMEPDMRKALGMNGANPYKQVVDGMVQELSTNGVKAQTFIIASMNTPKVREAWRLAFLNQIRLMDKAYVLADYLLHKPALQKSWAQNLTAILSRDPSLLEKIISSLSYRKVGNTEWTNKIDNARRDLARVLVHDRVMFEQIIAGKTIPFAQAFKGAVNHYFGPDVLKVWMPTPRVKK